MNIKELIQASKSPYGKKVLSGHMPFIIAENSSAVIGSPEDSIRKFKILAYTGGLLNFYWSEYPVVVDLAGMRGLDKSRPILKDHSSSLIVGHTTSIVVADNQLHIEGIVSGASTSAREVVESSDLGFPWQASIGADIISIEYIDAKTSATVNGNKFEGPILVVTESNLRETSFVAMGADDNTITEMLAASRGLTEKPDLPTELTGATEMDLDKMREDAATELERISKVSEICAGNSTLAAKAIREKWSADKAEVEMLKANRPLAPVINGGSVEHDVLNAAVHQALNLKTDGFDDRTLQAAHTRYRGKLDLSELLIEAARANGYTGSYNVRSNLESVLRAAWSTTDIGGILSNVANKALLDSFMNYEQSWRAVSSQSRVTDFKEISRYRLTGAGGYKKVAPGGEIKSGNLSEVTFGNKADTYALMYSITRQDMINDDLGALIRIPSILGRDSALTINDVFWTEWLDDSAFFTTGNANLITGTAGALSIDALTAAETKFLDQVTEEGKPLGIAPSIILVPNALRVTGAQIVNSTELRDTTASVKSGTTNPHAGKFTVVQSAYLNNSTIPGGSATGWYLLANPLQLPAIDVAFLDGREVPTIETSEADFNVLGIRMRGFHDFGIRKQDPKGAVKSTGVAP